MAALDRLFGHDDRVLVVPATLAQAIDQEDVKMTLRDLFTQDGIEFLIAPLNFGNNHWCGLAVRVGRSELLYYDSMSSSYTSQAQQVTYEFLPLLAQRFGKEFQIRAYSASSDCQTDNYNAVFSCCYLQRE